MKYRVFLSGCVLLSVFSGGCTSLFNPSYKQGLVEVRKSKFLINEDKTKTIGGVDANNNGIRDDVEHYINSKYQHNSSHISIYQNYARNYRNYLVHGADSVEKNAAMRGALYAAMHCAISLDHKLYEHQVLGETELIRSLHTNTRDRFKQVWKVNDMVRNASSALYEGDCEKD